MPNEYLNSPQVGGLVESLKKALAEVGDAHGVLISIKTMCFDSMTASVILKLAMKRVDPEVITALSAKG